MLLPLLFLLLLLLRPLRCQTNVTRKIKPPKFQKEAENRGLNEIFSDHPERLQLDKVRDQTNSRCKCLTLTTNVTPGLMLEELSADSDTPGRRHVGTDSSGF